ncbi:hypothetical protein MKW94_019529, partial [Papaver nudicaule]|nr:hypothetical protein [Papaver nudicaule]
KSRRMPQSRNMFYFVGMQIIVLEDTKEYISYVPNSLSKQVILNPKLEKKCTVEHHLEVVVTGLGRDGKPIKVEASCWQARILQHECDHLDGTMYVDRMAPKTFRTVENLELRCLF